MEKKLQKELVDLTEKISKLGNRKLFKTIGILEMMKMCIIDIHKSDGKNKD